MTKLTQQEIEQERVAFEKIYSRYLKCQRCDEQIEILLRPIWNGDRYVYPRYEVDFIYQFILARAELAKESSNVR